MIYAILDKDGKVLASTDTSSLSKGYTFGNIPDRFSGKVIATVSDTTLRISQVVNYERIMDIYGINPNVDAEKALSLYMEKRATEEAEYERKEKEGAITLDALAENINEINAAICALYELSFGGEQ